MAWLPLESNPDVMNKYLHCLGVPNKWNVIDVYTLDEDYLNTIPKPVISVLLLFPWSNRYRDRTARQEAEIVEQGQEVSEKVYHLKQTISNACGTIALIHSIANNMDKMELGDGHLKQFIEDTLPLKPDERGALLEKAQGIINTHKELALEGQTRAPGASEPINFHFVALVQREGCLYELDGSKPFPVNHGETSGDKFLHDAVKVIKDYIAQDPEEMHFTVLAVTASE